MTDSLQVTAPGSRRALAALQPGLFGAVIEQCFAQGAEPSEADQAFVQSVYPHFKARVLALQVDSPRRASFEPWMNLNPQVGFLDGIMGQRAVPAHPAHIILVLPERWLNPVEQGLLMQRLHEYAGRTPGALTQVDVVTQCPVILTDFSRSQIRVLTTPFPL